MRQPKFQLGQEVTLMGELRCVIDSITFHRERVRPIYKVEIWEEGDFSYMNAYESQLSER